ncbi:MAG: gamma-glutamylcyclotransferase [Rhodospirillum sp.]|jgi:glutathione-specific gamma-glutamylcyclotransferase|nr:gamma-glutamylcyclotransferase [Rhodospirillum sp.]
MKGPMALTAELVARCERHEPDPGPDPRVRYFTPAEYEAVADRLIEQAPLGPLWVFAYGSLIWKPAIATADHRRAVAHGWHRSFCLKLTRWRGSAAQPGLMMGLKRRGRCNGVVHRIPDDDRRSLLVQLLRREIGNDKHLTGVRWINVDTDQGRTRALTFWAEPVGLENWVSLPLPEVAQILARACGHGGSGAAYLFHTVSKLDELGIRDRNLWRLQQMVADEIRGMYQTSLAAPQSFPC